MLVKSMGEIPHKKLQVFMKTKQKNKSTALLKIALWNADRPKASEMKAWGDKVTCPLYSCPSLWRMDFLMEGTLDCVFAIYLVGLVKLLCLLLSLSCNL